MLIVISVLDVFPIAAPTALFSDALVYRFRLRPITATTDGGRPAFMAGAEEWTFDFRFTPTTPGGGAQTGTCTTFGGAVISFQVGDEEPTEASGLRIFAGQRLDPSSSTWLPSRPTTCGNG